MQNFTTQQILILTLCLCFQLASMPYSFAQCPVSTAAVANPNPGNPAKDIIMDLGIPFLSGGNPVACSIAATAEEPSITITWNNVDYPYTKMGGATNTAGNCGVTYVYDAASPNAPANPPADIETPYTAEYPTFTCDYAASGALPVEITNFRAKLNGKMVYLNWLTAAEVNNNYFEVLRSSDGRSWKSLALIDGAGTTNMAVNYEFIDTDPLKGGVYYALSQTDFDGTVEMLSVEFVKTEREEVPLKLFPNPTSDQLTVQIGGEVNLPIDIRIFNAAGKLTEFIQVEDFNQNISVSHLESGFYYLQIHTGGQIETQRFLKQ